MWLSVRKWGFLLLLIQIIIIKTCVLLEILWFEGAFCEIWYDQELTIPYVSGESVHDQVGQRREK